MTFNNPNTLFKKKKKIIQFGHCHQQEQQTWNSCDDIRKRAWTRSMIVNDMLDFLFYETIMLDFEVQHSPGYFPPVTFETLKNILVWGSFDYYSCQRGVMTAMAS